MAYFPQSWIAKGNVIPRPAIVHTLQAVIFCIPISLFLSSPLQSTASSEQLSTTGVTLAGDALLRAARSGDTSTVRTLLQQGVNPETRSRGKSSQTPLVLASAAGHFDSVKVLIDSEAKVDSRDGDGLTALNWASMRGRYQIAQLLLEKGADVNTRDNDDITPLLYATGTQNIDLMNLLIRNGADLESETITNKVTPLLLGVQQGNTLVVKTLLDHGANVNGANIDGFTPLMAAAEKGHIGLVELLLAHGADPRILDSSGP